MDQSESSSLQQRVVSGYLYAAIYFGGYYIFLILSRVFLYRILTPDDFGIYNVALGFLGTVNIIGGLGILSAVIQREGDETEIISTGASMVMVSVSLAFLILILFSNTIANAYQDPNMVPIFIILCLTSIISLGGVSTRVIARRHIEFKRLYISMLLKDISAGLVALFLAFRGFGFWSLIYGYALSEIILFILSFTYILRPFRSKYRNLFNPMKFSKNMAKTLLKLGFGLFLANATIQFLKNLIPMVTGHFLDFEAAGILSAVLFFILIFENFIFHLSEVTFSAFSRIQQEHSAIQNGINKFVRYSSFFVIPYFVVLETIGDRIIGIILGEQWIPPQGEVLQIIAWTVLIIPVGLLGTAILKSFGNSRDLILVNIARITAFLLVSFGLVPSFGLVGLALGILAQYFLLFGLLVALRGQFSFFKPIFASYKKAVIIALIMALWLLFFHNKINDFYSLLLVISTSLGLFYGGLYLIEGKIFLNDIRDLFHMITRIKR